jgi:hypothetical protein
MSNRIVLYRQNGKSKKVELNAPVRVFHIQIRIDFMINLTDEYDTL